MKKMLLLLACLSGLAEPTAAEVIGQNRPAPSLTAERVNAVLPPSERRAWLDYLRRSQQQMSLDKTTLAAELLPGQIPPPPPQAVGGDQHNMPLDRDPAWYGSAEARVIADTIASFQTPTGGWSKNQNRAGPRRLPGQRYANDAETMNPDRSNFDAPADRFWTFVGTLDNDATTSEMKFLARVAAALPGREGEAYRASFVRGVRYLLMAQYPNGGWPQVYPLEGGFHDGITFNDNAVAQAAMLLQEVAELPQYGFVPSALRRSAARATERATALILRAQRPSQGSRGAAWPQQVDALTLGPISARNYEPRALASGETTDILLFLMGRHRPSPAEVCAIERGVAWLRDRAVYGYAWTRTPQGRRLIPEPGAGPLWSRIYDLGTSRPIFGDVDKAIHDDVNGISLGRRNGYNWYVTAPQRALETYAQWRNALSGARRTDC